jgi:predicted 3-demethylubiquinone-9 3-methyltransferase (glyoxalase superfamily)
MQRITPNLWINDGKIEEAVAFYCSLFEDSRVVSSSDYGPEAGEWAGQKMALYFELQGQPFVAINGADTRFEANESVSLAIPCDTQEEIDRLWDALVDGGEPGPCGWLKDRYGFSWQVYPTVLDKMMADSDPERVRRVTACFMAIDKRAFRIDELEAAFAGA